ncbi:hypothetical protein G6F22_018235 [Rhizopus arrhizus]|nr:hypothetical protein G6F22_018235 [Rhizopus arrhizus]
MADIVAVDHHRRQRHAGALGQFPGIKAIDEGRCHVFAEGFHHLHHQLAPAWHFAGTGGLLASLDPGVAGVAAATRIRAHVRCAAEAGDAVARGRGAVALQVDLQGRADEHVAGIQAGGLRERAVGAHGAIGAGEEHIASCGDVLLHAQFGAE